MTSNDELPRILIVEDEPLIAAVFSEVLLDAEFAVAGVVSKIDDALAIIEGDACDGAILDTNLFGVSSVPIAEALAARGIRYLVISGYLPEQLPVMFQDAPFLRKPVGLEQLIDAFRALFPKE